MSVGNRQRLFQRSAISWNELEKLIHPFVSEPTPGRFIFRGQSDHRWSLEPKLRRIFSGSNYDTQKWKDIESYAFEKFRNHARHQLPNQVVPGKFAVLPWWAFMQHHQAPTRLLDWTTSPYIALYFACIGDRTVDGSVFWVDAEKLDELNRDRKLVPGEHMRDYHVKDTGQTLFRYRPWLNTDRMVAQQGLFTVSGGIVDDHETILNMLDQQLARAETQTQLGLAGTIIVSSKLKADAFRRLRFMNISAQSLFPGLDGVGRSIDEDSSLIDLHHSDFQALLERIQDMRRDFGVAPPK